MCWRRLMGAAGVAAAVSMACSGWAFAGPITPPPGPVAGTHKTLTEVEPRVAINAVNTRGDANSVYKIVLPGSYYLTGNVAGVSGFHAIEIAADNVTIDLMGFSVIGVAGSLDGLSDAGVARKGIIVANGVVRSFGGTGVLLESSSGVTVRGVTAIGNTSDGIVIGSGMVEACVASENGQSGVRLVVTGVIERCTANDNGLNGVMASGALAVIGGCQARGNAGNGVSSGPGSTVIDCVALENDLGGFLLADSVVVRSCAARANAATGFTTGSASIVTGCTSRSNAGHGFSLDSGSFIEGCISTSNAQHGIVATFRTTIRNNHCSLDGISSTGAGIFVFGSDTTIEGNTCVSADRGIEVTSTGNLIIGNRCAGNTIDYLIAANNRYGPIIDIRASGGVAVSGSAAAGNVTTTDPWANFSY